MTDAPPETNPPARRLARRPPMDLALDAVTPYGWALLPDGTFVSPKGKETGVKLIGLSTGRYQARMKPSGALLWSGPDPAKFLEQFWLAVRKRPMTETTPSENAP